MQKKIIRIMVRAERRVPCIKFRKLNFLLFTSTLLLSVLLHIVKTDKNSNQIQAHMTQGQGTYVTYMCQTITSVAKRSLLYRIRLFSNNSPPTI
jgi:hypothetical protein